MRCKKMDELPVVTEWQNEIYCPNCKHYTTGECKNPARVDENSKCPFDGKELLVKLVEESELKIGQNVVAELDCSNRLIGTIIEKTESKFGNMYRLKLEHGYSPWILEKIIHPIEFPPVEVFPQK